MEVKIVKAELSDIDKMISLSRKNSELWASYDIKFFGRKEMEFVVKSNKYIVLKAIDKNNSFLGFIFGEIRFDSVLIYFLCIDKKFRGIKIGTKLFKRLVEIAKKKNIYFFWGYVNSEFKNSMKFWEKMGFKKGNKFIFIYKDY